MIKHVSILTALAVAAAIPASTQTAKVGTFHRGSIVVAYYRSPMWADVLKAKSAEMQQARAANDSKKIEDLDRWGRAQQDLSHRQLAGDAPIDNILAALTPAFAEIEKQAHVASVKADDSGAGVQTLDVTDQLLDWLKADARTRSIVKDLRKQGP